MQQAKIQYLRNEQIDKDKWDACIRSSFNSMIYAQAHYLDAMADHWDALVYGDYEVVMPLTWRKKYGIKYLYQPAFIQQLGIFGSVPINDKLLQQFIQITRKLFRFCEIFLNEKNPVEESAYNASTITRRTNYVLTLDRPHKIIQQSYKQTILQHIGKAIRNQVEYVQEIEEANIISAYEEYLGSGRTHLSTDDFLRFKAVCAQMKGRGFCITRGVKDNRGNLLAQAILLKDHARLYNIMSVITPMGRELRANHFLYDSILNEFANSGLVFDFEGSEIPGVSVFYKSFGAFDKPYYFFKYNDLPWWIKFFKK